MDAHYGPRHTFDVKYIRFPAVHPRYVIDVSAFTKRITFAMMPMWNEKNRDKIIVVRNSVIYLLGVLLYEYIAQNPDFYLATARRPYFNRHQIFSAGIKGRIWKEMDLVPSLPIVASDPLKFYRNNIFPYYRAHLCLQT